MSWCHIQPCPMPKCNELVPVYLNRDNMAEWGELFTYICPKCQKRIVLSFPAAAHVETIPQDAVVCEPYNR